jgi:hypothetical protein
MGYTFQYPIISISPTGPGSWIQATLVGFPNHFAAVKAAIRGRLEF